MLTIKEKLLKDNPLSHYANGLPFKPVIYPLSHELLFVKSQQTNGLCVYLSDESLQELKNIEIESVDLEDGELWVSSGDYYIVVPNLSDETLKCIEEKKLLISFFDKSVKTLAGLKIS